MAITKLKSIEELNIDLGRPITSSDIVANGVYPLPVSEEGCFCYLCRKQSGGGDSQLQPLTMSSGVFTSKVLCEMDSPVFVCLEHIPFSIHEFEAFTPSVAEELRSRRITH